MIFAGQQFKKLEQLVIFGKNVDSALQMAAEFPSLTKMTFADGAVNFASIVAELLKGHYTFKNLRCIAIFDCLLREDTLIAQLEKLKIQVEFPSSKDRWWHVKV